MNPIVSELKVMAVRLRELFPEVGCVYLGSGENQHFTVAFHRVGNYAQGTILMQRLEIGERQKSILDQETESPWSTLKATVEGLGFTTYCDGLPPSCKVVIETKKIPKVETRESGEFIEVFQRRVVCGGEA